jgi:hypothetical protein
LAAILRSVKKAHELHKLTRIKTKKNLCHLRNLWFQLPIFFVPLCVSSRLKLNSLQQHYWAFDTWFIFCLAPFPVNNKELSLKDDEIRQMNFIEKIERKAKKKVILGANELERVEFRFEGTMGLAPLSLSNYIRGKTQRARGFSLTSALTWQFSK